MKLPYILLWPRGLPFCLSLTTSHRYHSSPIISLRYAGCLKEEMADRHVHFEDDIGRSSSRHHHRHHHRHRHGHGHSEPRGETAPGPTYKAYRPPPSSNPPPPPSYAEHIPTWPNFNRFPTTPDEVGGRRYQRDTVTFQGLLRQSDIRKHLKPQLDAVKAAIQMVVAREFGLSETPGVKISLTRADIHPEDNCNWGTGPGEYKSKGLPDILAPAIVIELPEPPPPSRRGKSKKFREDQREKHDVQFYNAVWKTVHTIKKGRGLEVHDHRLFFDPRLVRNIPLDRHSDLYQCVFEFREGNVAKTIYAEQPWIVYLPDNGVHTRYTPYEKDNPASENVFRSWAKYWNQEKRVDKILAEQRANDERHHMR
ncbi:hypothetical protein F4819DRAFT_458455 [Hypoxylon fuscum]|nr:hypothetical protein F4819DRAFT_458455 [Hypoxylon fuscum]